MKAPGTLARSQGAKINSKLRVLYRKSPAKSMSRLEIALSAAIFNGSAFILARPAYARSAARLFMAVILNPAATVFIPGPACLLGVNHDRCTENCVWRSFWNRSHLPDLRLFPRSSGKGADASFLRLDR